MIFLPYSVRTARDFQKTARDFRKTARDFPKTAREKKFSP